MNYSYGNYGNYNNYGYYQPQQQTQQPQTIYYSLTYVNGIEGAKAFIVQPNQIVYLKDSDSDVLFEKKADQQGRLSLTAYKLTKVDLNNLTAGVVNDNYITSENLETRLSALETLLDTKIDKLTDKIEKLSRTQISGQKTKNNGE